jgi:hypothetical protein
LIIQCRGWRFRFSVTEYYQSTTEDGSLLWQCVVNKGGRYDERPAIHLSKLRDCKTHSLTTLPMG